MLYTDNGTADQIRFITVHCSATPPKAAARQTIKDIDKMHREREFDMAGYHVFIRRDGTVEFGRAFGHKGAHVRWKNANNIGVCLAGGVDNSLSPVEGGGYSPHQWMALERVLRSLCLMFPEARCRGHRDFPGVAKACPCFCVEERFRNVRGVNV